MLVFINFFSYSNFYVFLHLCLCTFLFTFLLFENVVIYALKCISLAVLRFLITNIPIVNLARSIIILRKRKQ